LTGARRRGKNNATTPIKSCAAAALGAAAGILFVVTASAQATVNFPNRTCDMGETETIFGQQLTARNHATGRPARERIVAINSLR
jgi:hypothetical protein